MENNCRMFKPVEVYNYSSKEEFINFVKDNRKPLILRGLNIGTCRSKWSVSYLVESIKDLKVSIHASPTGQMSFIKKNFSYVKLPFDEFLYRASGEMKSHDDQKYKPILCENEVLYFRSISFDRRGREIADLSKHFPEIANDFNIPDLFNHDDFFSSVFRIASPGVQVWTHYDIMDNVLVQICGTKKVVLFSPRDADYLYMNGDKSEVLDIENPDITKYPLFLKASQYEGTLLPGDALFIPALWFHNTISKTFSISVNVFWKNLPHEIYDKSDVYGNKDLIPAVQAFSNIKKAIELLNTLPSDYKHFYISRCIGNLKKALEDTSSGSKTDEKAAPRNDAEVVQENLRRVNIENYNPDS